MKVLVLHGVNLNMFGKRDPALYGTITLAEIDAQLQALAKELGVQLECFQTNSEGAMCERIQKAFAEMGVMDYATIDVAEQLANDGKVAEDFDKKMFVEKAIAAE